VSLPAPPPFSPKAHPRGGVAFTRVRSTALAIAYNIAVMMFGGFAQFFVTWLIQATGTPIAPAYYLMFGAAVGLLAALFLKERARDARFLVTDAVEPTAA
jgi:MFS transporter, MHS family, proline/betaine transporter